MQLGRSFPAVPVPLRRTEGACHTLGYFCQPVLIIAKLYGNRDMRSRTFPEGALVYSFIGYTVVGFFVIYTPLWGAAFALAFSVTAAGVRVWARIVPMDWIEAWAKIVPLAWVVAWAFVVATAGSGGGVVAGAFAGVVAWFVSWAVGRRVAFSLAGRGFGAVPVVLVFAVTGAVTWFVFGAVAGRVALAVARGDFWVVAVVVAWAWAWAWAWFVFEAFAGVVGGSVVWAFAGAALGVVVGIVVLPWALAGAFAGAVSGAMSEAANELRKSFCKYHTFLILALTSLSGLGLGRLLSGVFL